MGLLGRLTLALGAAAAFTFVAYSLDPSRSAASQDRDAGAAIEGVAVPPADGLDPSEPATPLLVGTLRGNFWEVDLYSLGGSLVATVRDRTGATVLEMAPLDDVYRTCPDLDLPAMLLDPASGIDAGDLLMMADQPPL